VFIDSSALVAILALEPGHEALSSAIEQAKAPITSGLVRLETVMRLSSKLRTTPEAADAAFDRLIEAGAIAVIPITDDLAKTAVRAFAKYGKGRGHPAQLNLADCLHYAVAKAHRAPMLLREPTLRKPISSARCDAPELLINSY
jgi:ribonuclease VapC